MPKGSPSRFHCHPAAGGVVDFAPCAVEPGERPGMGIAGADHIFAPFALDHCVADGVTGGNAGLAEKEGCGGREVFAVSLAIVQEKIANRTSINVVVGRFFKPGRVFEMLVKEGGERFQYGFR